MIIHFQSSIPSKNMFTLLLDFLTQNHSNLDRNQLKEMNVQLWSELYIKSKL